MNPDLDPREFAGIAETLRVAPTPTRTAEDIVDYVRKQLEANRAGLTLLRARRRLETIAPTDPLVEQADRLQYELDEVAEHLIATRRLPESEAIDGHHWTSPARQRS